MTTVLQRLLRASEAMQARAGKPDSFEMPGVCKCGRSVVLKRRPWRWVMPHTELECDHRD